MTYEEAHTQYKALTESKRGHFVSIRALTEGDHFVSYTPLQSQPSGYRVVSIQKRGLEVLPLLCFNRVCRVPMFFEWTDLSRRVPVLTRDEMAWLARLRRIMLWHTRKQTTQ